MDASADSDAPGGGEERGADSSEAADAVLRAASTGETDAVLALLNTCECPRRVCSEALLWAASSGHVETLRALAQHCNADVEQVSENGWNAAMYAARNGHTAAVVTLVQEFGCRADHATSVGRTAIMYAASHGHTATALALALECGADVRRRDVRGFDAIMYASAAGHAATAEALERAASLASAPPPPEPSALRAAGVRVRLDADRTTDQAQPGGAHEVTAMTSHKVLKRKGFCEGVSPSSSAGENAGQAPHGGEPEPERESSVDPHGAFGQRKRAGRRVVTSHLPRKVSTPPLPRPGPCAEGGGLWTILEHIEVGGDS